MVLIPARCALAFLGAALAAAIAMGSAPALAQISVPWIAQKNATDCGRAVLASLAARRGGNPEKFYSRIPEPADLARGYSVPEMQRHGARLNVRLALRAPAGVVITGQCAPTPAVSDYFKRLARSVSAGRPVVVPVTTFSNGHYLVLVGASGDSFTVLDPARPGLRSMSTAALASAMCGFGYVALEAR
jgi:ABC-type bacteriocin/lantibiotic exporter with double-glycine peptidase domain